MKKIILIIAIFTGFSLSIFAQAPNGFNYQAVARDADNIVYENTIIALRISLIEDAPSGIIRYIEQHLVTTSDLGIFSLQIGTGTDTYGDFSTINWGNHSFFIKIEADPAGGVDYNQMGISQLLSVPYALYAREAGNSATSADDDPTNEIQTLSIDGTTLIIEDGNAVDLSVIQDGVEDDDADPNNEIQTLSIDGNIITLSHGGDSVTLPNNGSSTDIDGLTDGKNDGSSIFLGEGAGELDDGGNRNIALGKNALKAVTAGRFNVAIGNNSLDSLTTGDKNIAIGYAALSANDNNYNTAIGVDAGQKNTGERNTMLGFGAGLNNVEGNSNVFLGIDAGKNELGSNKLYIDNNSSSFPLIYGDFNSNIVAVNGYLGIGTKTPTVELEVKDPNGWSRLKINSSEGQRSQLLLYEADTLGFIFELRGEDDRLDLRSIYPGDDAKRMTWLKNGNVGIGHIDPDKKLNVRGESANRHIMQIENTSNSPDADGLEIKINRNKTGAGNNFITFRSGDGGVAGRIEGFNFDDLNGEGFSDFPEVDFNDYFNPVTLDFDPGTPPSLTGGAFPTIIAPGLTINFLLGTFNYTAPFLAPGVWPNFDAGTPPSLSGGLNTNFNPVGNAIDKLQEVTCWALENGERSLITTNPYDLTMMVGTGFLDNLAECKDGGITYGSGGADYAEWLLKEDVNTEMQAGQIVGVKGGNISLNTEDAEQLLVISSMPIILGNQPAEHLNEADFEKVAFLGQAPVWVIGMVRSGDYIIPSGHNDGYGLAISPNDLSIKHISKIIGRAWSDADAAVNLVNMVIGLKTNELETILQNFETRVQGVETRMDRMEAFIGNNSAEVPSVGVESK